MKNEGCGWFRVKFNVSLRRWSVHRWRKIRVEKEEKQEGQGGCDGDDDDGYRWSGVVVVLLLSTF